MSGPYYNVWNNWSSRWTNATIDAFGRQDINRPYKLSLKQAEILLSTVQYVGGDEYEIRVLPNDEIYKGQVCSGCNKSAPHQPPNTITGNFLCVSCKVVADFSA